jgi:hypothetical protein
MSNKNTFATLVPEGGRGMHTQQVHTVPLLAAEIPGYTYGSPDSARSPISVKDFDLLQRAAGFTSDDVRWLRAAGEAFLGHTQKMVKAWRDVIAAQPDLMRYALDLDGHKDERYSQRSGLRFEQWILDTCFRDYDEDWLNYQQEIALRHTSLKKNKTDSAHSAPTIHLRYIIAFMAIVADPNLLKPFLRHKYEDESQIERMHQAWTKSMWLQIALWTAPYTHSNETPDQW